MSLTRKVWRKVVSLSPDEHTELVRIELECGHFTHLWPSSAAPKVAYCVQCKLGPADA